MTQSQLESHWERILPHLRSIGVPEEDAARLALGTPVLCYGDIVRVAYQKVCAFHREWGMSPERFDPCDPAWRAWVPFAISHSRRGLYVSVDPVKLQIWDEPVPDMCDSAFTIRYLGNEPDGAVVLQETAEYFAVGEDAEPYETMTTLRIIFPREK